MLSTIHTHDNPTLPTFGCPACIARVAADQEQEQEQEQPPSIDPVGTIPLFDLEPAR